MYQNFSTADRKRSELRRRLVRSENMIRAGKARVWPSGVRIRPDLWDLNDYESHELAKSFKKIKKEEVKPWKAKTVLPTPKKKKDAPKVDETALVRSVCSDSFYEFVREFWDVVVPETPVWNWHIRFLCDELQHMAERVFRGEEKQYDLVVNIAPGTTKSMIMSVMFPAWCLARMPSFRFIGASYSFPLAMDLSMKTRDVMTSDKYLDCFPATRLRNDQNTKGNFKTTRNGFRIAVGVNGTITGYHAHFIVIDDPLNPQSAQSAADIAAANHWIKHTLSNRKVSKSVSCTALVMQRLHQDDPTAAFLRNKKVRHVLLPAEIEKDENGRVNVKPVECIGMYKDGLMDPVRMSRTVLDEEKAKGEYYYQCTPGFSPVLMADWREKDIKDVKVGDKVMGFGDGDSRSKRTVLKPAKVLDKGVLHRQVMKLTMEDGKEVYCTEDHKWFVLKKHVKGKDGKYHTRMIYRPAKVGRCPRGNGGDWRGLVEVYERVKENPNLKKAWGWLAGMIDGEGACRHGNVSITRSYTHNRKVCEKIERVLEVLDIPYTLNKTESRDRVTGAPAGDEFRIYILKGGRTTKIRIINHGRPAKSCQIAAAIGKGGVAENRRNGGGQYRKRVVKTEPVGVMPVYWLKTETGNYVVWGYASANSQFMQSPVPPGGGTFKVTRLKYGIPPAGFQKVVRFWDKAGTAGGGAYTVGTKIALDWDNRFWVLDVVRVQLEAFEREKLIEATAVADGYETVVGVEQEPGSGGKESAEMTVKNLQGFRVKVVKADKSTGGKEWRADPWAAQVNAGHVYLPQEVVEYDGRKEGLGMRWGGWAKEWVEELKYFPFSKYMDQVDSSSGAFALCHKKQIRIGGLTPSLEYARRQVNNLTLSGRARSVRRSKWEERKARKEGMAV